MHVVELPANANEEAVARALARNPHVKFAEVDTIVSASATTNDPILPQEWQITKIGASTAWNTSTGAGIVVAVLDSGVQSNHPDLQANLVPGWNIYNNNNLTNDVNGHGTAVAGTIAAVGNDGIGVAGVAYRAKIMPVRISDSACNTTLSLDCKRPDLGCRSWRGYREHKLQQPLQELDSDLGRQLSARQGRRNGRVGEQQRDQ